MNVINYKTIAVTGMVAGLAVTLPNSNEFSLDAYLFRDHQHVLEAYPVPDIEIEPTNETYSPAAVELVNSSGTSDVVSGAVNVLAAFGTELEGDLRARVMNVFAGAAITARDVISNLNMAYAVLGDHEIKSVRVAVVDASDEYAAVVAVLRVPMSRDEIFDLNSRLAYAKIDTGLHSKSGFSVSFGRASYGDVA